MLKKSLKYIIAFSLSMIASAMLAFDKATTLELRAGSGGPCGGPGCATGGPCNLELCVQRPIDSYTFNLGRFILLSITIFIVVTIIMQIVIKLRARK